MSRRYPGQRLDSREPNTLKISSCGTSRHSIVMLGSMWPKAGFFLGPGGRARFIIGLAFRQPRRRFHIFDDSTVLHCINVVESALRHIAYSSMQGPGHAIGK